MTKEELMRVLLEQSIERLNKQIQGLSVVTEKSSTGVPQEAKEILELLSMLMITIGERYDFRHFTTFQLQDREKDTINVNTMVFGEYIEDGPSNTIFDKTFECMFKKTDKE